MRLWLVEFYTLFRIQVSLDIKKKRGSSIYLNIHHSKVFSSGFWDLIFTFFIFIYLKMHLILFRYSLRIFSNICSFVSCWLILLRMGWERSCSELLKISKRTQQRKILLTPWGLHYSFTFTLLRSFKKKDFEY